MSKRQPLRPCRQPQCGQLVAGGGWCDKHKPKQFEDKGKKADKHRPSAAARGYGSKWQRARYAFLMRNPLCVKCQAQGRTTAATVVDHIEDHKGDQRKFWDWSNWQALCHTCHSKKTYADNRQRITGQGMPAAERPRSRFVDAMTGRDGHERDR